MKGPYERLKYDLRRIWECPVCQHRERTAGTVTYVVCRCQQKESAERRQVMKLVEDHIRRIPHAIPVRPTVDPPPSSEHPSAATEVAATDSNAPNNGSDKVEST